mmetsp:Transcript_84100/g.147865  ORF Transcript_84100/g.147865 Transcript_84100/m.147865 type:complete len:180 (-) Transcript_84100:228-767(-)
MYTRSNGVEVVARVIAPSPSGDQYRHIQYVQTRGAQPVDNIYASLLRMSPVRSSTPPPPDSPRSSPPPPEASTLDPVDPPPPQASNSEVRQVENRAVRRKVQGGLEKFFSRRDLVDGIEVSEDGVCTLNFDPPKRARSPTYARNVVAVTCTKRPVKRRPKVLVQNKPLHKFRRRACNLV